MRGKQRKYLKNDSKLVDKLQNKRWYLKQTIKNAKAKIKSINTELEVLNNKYKTSRVSNVNDLENIVTALVSQAYEKIKADILANTLTKQLNSKEISNVNTETAKEGI